MDEDIIRVISEYVPPPRPFITIEEQKKIIDELLCPTTSIRCKDVLAYNLQVFVSCPETKEEELFYLSSMTGLKQLAEIIEQWSLSSWPNKHISFIVDILSVLTFKRKLVTFGTAEVSKVLDAVLKLIRRCTSLFEYKKSEIMWSVDEEHTWRHLYVHAVLVAINYTYNPERSNYLPQFSLQTFVMLKKLFDKIASGNIESNGWNIDWFGTVVILYMITVLKCKTYTDLFVKSGIEDLLLYLRQRRTPEDYSEITKIYDINMLHIIHLLCVSSLDILDTSLIASGLTNYVQMNTDYIAYYHQMYTKEKIIEWVVCIVLDICLKSPKGAFQFYNLKMPILLSEFLELPVDDFNYDIGTNRMETVTTIFLNGNYPPNENISRDVSGYVLFAIFTMKCGAHNHMGVGLTEEEYETMVLALNTKAPVDILNVDTREYIENEKEKIRKEIEVQKIKKELYKDLDEELDEELEEEEEEEYDYDDNDDDKEDELPNQNDLVVNINKSFKAQEEAFEHNKEYSTMQIGSFEETNDSIPIEISSADSEDEQFPNKTLEDLKQPTCSDIEEIERAPISSEDIIEPSESQTIPSFGDLNLYEEEIFETEIIDTVETTAKNSIPSDLVEVKANSEIPDYLVITREHFEVFDKQIITSAEDPETPPSSDLVEVKARSSELEDTKKDYLIENFEEYERTTPSLPGIIQFKDLQSELGTIQSQDLQSELQSGTPGELQSERSLSTEKETVASDEVKKEPLSSISDCLSTPDGQKMLTGAVVNLYT